MSQFRETLKTAPDKLLVDEALGFANYLVKREPNPNGENQIADLIRELCTRLEEKSREG